MRLVVLVVLWGLVVVQSVEAANHYVRAGASGTASGADWTNAYLDLPNPLVRGDTYYVAAGTYAARTFNDAESGASVITIQAATIGDHGSSTGWSDTFVGQAVFRQAVTTTANTWVFTKGYYTFNGVYGCGPTATCGFQVDASGYNLSSGCSSSAAVEVEPGVASNLTFKYVEVKGTSNVNAVNPILDYAFWLRNGNSTLLLSNLWVHDQGAGWIISDGTTGLTLERSVFRNMRSTPACHAGGVLLRGPSGVGNTNLTVRYNVFENADGTGNIESPINSGVTSSNWYVYGNVFAYNAGESNGQATANGMFQLFSINITGDFFVYNNTISALDRGPGSSGSCNIFLAGGQTIATLTVRNNLWYNCKNSVTRATVGVTTLVWTHNAYYDTTTTDPDTDKQVAAGNPFVNVSQLAGGTNFHLASATTAGVTLASPYDTDPDNVTRGADGAWDRGAYEVGGGSPSVPGPPGGGGKAPTRRRR